jgi:hypothetical protein
MIGFSPIRFLEVSAWYDPSPGNGVNSGRGGVKKELAE